MLERYDISYAWEERPTGLTPRLPPSLTTIATNAPSPWDVARSGEVIIKVVEIWGILEGAWPMACASLNHCFHYLNEHGHGSPGGEFRCRQRLAHSLRWFCTVTEVDLHTVRGEFSCRSRWFYT
jgi:hypothetical protein